MNLEHLTLADLEGEAVAMAMEKFVAKVNYAFPPVGYPKPYEKPHTFRDRFSIQWEEFESMTKAELWDNYVKVIVRRTLLNIKNLARKRKTRVKFFKFDTPATTGNRRVLTYEANGVFFGLMFQRCAHQTTDVVEVTFQVKVGEFGK